MGDFRIKYGLSLGPYGTLSGTSSQFLLPPQDATPDVTNKGYCITGNTSAVNYTYFDGTLAGGLPGVEEGKVIIIHFKDNNTTVANAGRIFLAMTNAAFTSGQILALVHSNSSWYEIFRSQNSQEHFNQVSVAGTVAPDVTGVSYLIINPTAAATIVGLSGGYPGQQVILFKRFVSAGTTLTFQGADNFMLPGTTAFVTNSSAGYLFFQESLGRWRMVSGAVSP